jgi:O-succinylbenzoate synthase
MPSQAESHDGWHLAVRQYCRPFQTPLKTHHGLWQTRTGLIIRLISSTGAVGFGEVAPIPWFGTESLETALAYLQTLGLQPRLTDLQATPDDLPACQFGLQSAIAQIQHPAASPSPLPPAQICALLPTGAAALSHWQILWEAGHRTFKWKMGLVAPPQEQAVLAQLVAALPATAQLRLDANGGLTIAAAEQWLQHCQTLGTQIAFLEQPLPPEQWADLQRLGDRFGPLIALDESVATVTQLAQVCAAGWPGTVVIKPAIAGSPQRLQTLYQHYDLQGVFSSSLCTHIGRNAALAIAAQLDPTRKHALGFGVGQWFQDDWDALSAAQLWERLGH